MEVLATPVPPCLERGREALAQSIEIITGALQGFMAEREKTADQARLEYRQRVAGAIPLLQEYE
jgi:hypothetical protein